MTGSLELEETAASWLSRRDGGDWSTADQEALEDWLDQATAHRVAFLRLEAIWNAADRLCDKPSRVSCVRVPPRWPPARLASAIAACVALLLVAGTSYLLLRQPIAIHATEIGQRETLALNDGSKVDLNTDTRLLTVFDPTTREVWLDRGEAYFEVAHDPAHPFIVHAGARVVTVLGTKFSVRNENGYFRLVVTDGRVRLDDKGDGPSTRPLVLERGQIAVADRENVLLTQDTSRNLDAALAWRDGRIAFDNTTLGDAVAEFNRYSTRKLQIADPATRAIRISGRFSSGNSEGFARLMQSSLGLTVEHRRDAIVLSR